jgi:hypothetical protein
MCQPQGTASISVHGTAKRKQADPRFGSANIVDLTALKVGHRKTRETHTITGDRLWALFKDGKHDVCKYLLPAWEAVHNKNGCAIIFPASPSVYCMIV